MKIPQCEKEQDVLDALRSGRWAGPWGEEIRRHASECPVCAEVVLVAEALRRQDELAQPEIRLPSPGLVWWRAQLATRRAAAQQATRPISLVARVAQALGIFSLVGFVLYDWPQIFGWLGGAKHLVRVPRSFPAVPAWIQRSAGFLTTPPASWILLASTSALLVLMALAVYAVWREE